MTTPSDRDAAGEPVASGAPAGPPTRSTGAARWRRRWMILLAAALGLLLLAVLLWARDTPALRLARAPDATIAAGTARISLTSTVEGVPIAGTITLDVADGEVDLEAQQARMTREVPGLARLPIVGRGAAPLEVRFDGADVYLRLPLGGERRWVRLHEADEVQGQAGLRNPVVVLGLLRMLDGAPEDLGEDVVDGVPATRFRVVVDLDEAARQLGQGAARVAAGIRLVHGEARLPMDVWLDADDRVRRLRWQTTQTVAGVTDVVLATDLELRDFGIAVDTGPPDEAELLRLEDLAPLDVFQSVNPLQWLQDTIGRLRGTGVRPEGMRPVAVGQARGRRPVHQEVDHHGPL